MKKVALLVAGLVLFSIPLFAGEYLMNDTGETVYGLRVVFSEAVTLASFGDILTVVAPTGESAEFMFSGGTLEAWAGHWFNWEPASASLVSHEWFADPATVETAASDWAAYEASRPFWERNPNPTYEEIMAEIAKYPGPEEPLYEPAPDEAIWLTDIEGHADIYDNDSIKINYADSFDQSQITKIAVYRNGIKMLFLQDKFDVLTNEQMKTFDGNPAEHTPASSHTDHAIFGYEYHFKIHTEAQQQTTTVKIRSPFHYSGEEFVDIGAYPGDINAGAWTIPWMIEQFGVYKAMGFEGISFQVYYFMDSAQDSDLFSLPLKDTRIHQWGSTIQDKYIREILQAIDAVGLDAELRLEIWISNETRLSNYQAHRGALSPQNLDEWFENYGDICVRLAEIMEDESGDIFTPMVELGRTETHGDHVKQLMDRIRGVFSGRLQVSSQTNLFLAVGSLYDEETDWLTIADRATFWDYPDLEIGMNCWPSGAWENRNDQRFSVLIENLVSFWSVPFAYYSSRYPVNRLRFAEMGTPGFDGVSRGVGWFWGQPERMDEFDFQEISDLWSAYFFMAEYLDSAGVHVWTIWPFRDEAHLSDYELGDHSIGGFSAERCVVELIGGPVEAIPCMANRAFDCGQEIGDD